MRHCIFITVLPYAVLLAFCFCTSEAASRFVNANATVTNERRYTTTDATNVPREKFAKIRNAAAKLTINGFQKGGSGGGPSECDGKFHSDDTPIVALSTAWYANGERCFRSITIQAPNGESVSATVVDECDVVHAHCKPNIVDGSRAVWKALKVPQNQWGLLTVTWSDD